MASIGLHGLKLVAIHLSLFFGPKWTFCTVCLCKNCTIGKFWEFQIRNLFRTHLWHFQQAPSWILWGSTCPNHDWWCQYPLEGGFGTAKEARYVNSLLVFWKNEPPILHFRYRLYYSNENSPTATQTTANQNYFKNLRTLIPNIRRKNLIYCSPPMSFIFLVR